MRNKELNLTQFETLSDEELQKIEGGYLPIPDMPGWRGQSTPWWWSLKQSNFSDAYSSFYNATHQKEVFMGFGFNFKDYNDRLTFKKPILKEVKQTLDEQDFSKAEIAKEKKQKLKKFKEKTPHQRSFLPKTVALEKFEEFLEFRKMRGGLRPPLVGHWSKAKSHLLTPWY